LKRTAIEFERQIELRKLFGKVGAQLSKGRFEARIIPSPIWQRPRSPTAFWKTDELQRLCITGD
jgi:lipid-A-disaccharide synthase-like uncharacterized protein